MIRVNLEVVWNFQLSLFYAPFAPVLPETRYIEPMLLVSGKNRNKNRYKTASVEKSKQPPKKYNKIVQKIEKTYGTITGVNRRTFLIHLRYKLVMSQMRKKPSY